MNKQENEPVDKKSLCSTGKNGYDWRRLFLERTTSALLEDDHDPIEPTKVLQVKRRLFAYDALMNDATLNMLVGRLAPWIMPLRDFRILDIGCGFGRHAPFFSMFDCLEYVGIDVTPDRIAYAKRRYQGARVSFEIADAQTYRPAAPFDVVWCCTVLQHLPTPAKKRVVDTIKIALKPEGFGLLLEGRVLQTEDIEEHYKSKKCAAMMIPIEEARLREWFMPWVLIRDGVLFRIVPP